VIYHEPLGQAQETAGSNAAQGSSYRQFPPTEIPNVDVVRGDADRNSGSSPDAQEGHGGTL